MKKLNKVLAILCTSAVAVSVGAFAGCTKPDDGGTHTHNYNYTKVDDTNHKGECNVDGCDAPEITEAHNWGTDNKCEKCDAVKPTPVAVTKVEISGKTEAKVGEEVQLTATVTGTGNPAKTVTWTKVSGEGAVSADGKVTATAAGEVKVKATSTVDTTKSAEHTVTFAAAEVSLTLADSYVCVDDSGETTAEVTVNYDGEGTVTATSKNAEVATAAYAEGKITVTAVKTGKAVIEVTDGEKTAELTVEVATAGLTYETLGAEDAEGNAYEYVQVSDGEGRTSTDVYIPGYRYMEDAAEGEGALLPVTIIKAAPNGPGDLPTTSGGAFTNNNNIVSVYLGDNVVTVGASAFMDCRELTKVVCGPALKSIGRGAFGSSNGSTANACAKLTQFDSSKATTLLNVEGAAFRFSGLTEFVFPESCEFIGDSVFMGCEKLETVKILSEKVTKLWGSTFLNCACRGLKTLWLPASIVEIGAMDFGDYNGVPSEGVALDIYYSGTEQQYSAISINSTLNDTIKPSANSKLQIHYNSNFAEMLEAEKGE